MYVNSSLHREPFTKTTGRPRDTKQSYANKWRPNACSTLLTPLNSDTQNRYNHFFRKVQTIWGEGFRNILYRSCSQFSTCFIRREGTWKISRTILWYHLFQSLQISKNIYMYPGAMLSCPWKIKGWSSILQPNASNSYIGAGSGRHVGLDEGILGYKTKSTYALSS
jgi:hypothetical protein